MRLFPRWTPPSEPESHGDRCIRACRERRRPEIATAARDGILGRAAVQYWCRAGTALDCGGGAQRNFFYQLVDFGRAVLFSADDVCDRGIVHAISGRGRVVCVVQESVWGFSRIYRGLDVLGVPVFLFSGAADGECGDGCLYWRRQHGLSGTRPDVSGGGIVWTALCGGGAEYCGIEYRQVAAERGRGFDVCAAADAPGDGRVFVARARVGHAFHLAQYDAGVELGYGEFLAADCVCVCGPGALRDDERRSAQPPENLAARDFWFGDFNCADLYRGNFCGAFHVAGRCGRSQERRVPGFDVRIDDAADCFVWRDRGDSGDGGECWRRWRNGGGSGARAVCGGD